MLVVINKDSLMHVWFRVDKAGYQSVFAARCYASAALAVMRCLCGPSVCPSVTFVDSVKTSVSETIGKPPLVKARTALKNKKNIKYGENDFQYGGWNYYTLQCGTIMTLISPGDCTLQCGMWLWNHDSEFTKWQHHAMWRGSGMTCRWIRPMAAPCNVTHSSEIMTLNSPDASTLQCGTWLWDDMPWNRPNFRHIGILHLVSSLTISPQMICHSAPVCDILSKSDHPQQKKGRYVDFQAGGSQPS